MKTNIAEIDNNILTQNGDILCPIPITTTRIGNQVWSTVNLAINDGGKGIRVYDCGTVRDLYIGPQYYYTIEAAERVVSTIPGWRLPTLEDLEELKARIDYEYTGGTLLKSTSGWDSRYVGTDKFGFNAIPSGFYDNSQEEFKYVGSWAVFWTTSTPSTPQGRRYTLLLSSSTGIGISPTTAETIDCCSIRLIRDF